MLRIAVISEYGKGVGSKKRAIIMLGCIIVIFAILLGFVYILYIENARIISPVIVLSTIFILFSGIYLVKLLLPDIKKYNVNPGVT